MNEIGLFDEINRMGMYLGQLLNFSKDRINLPNSLKMLEKWKLSESGKSNVDTMSTKYSTPKIVEHWEKLNVDIP